MTRPKRRVCYVTGTRADFGLMQATLEKIHHHELLELSTVVTGMHLSTIHGNTVSEIEAAGFPISARIEVDLADPTGAGMARNIGTMISGFVDAFEQLNPDIVLLLGDRGEMLAGALAAIHLNLPIAHIHGGERSGTVDEPVRHAISKLSHIHFVATQDAHDRLVRMGESSAHIFVTGAPGLDGLEASAKLSRVALCRDIKFDPLKRLALFVFHPVLQEAEHAKNHVKSIMEALLLEGLQIIALMPNSDAGSKSVRAELAQFEQHESVRLLTHLPRPHFVSWMAACDVMVGNSSSGIIEAATFGTPVINVGIRQNLRQRNANIVDIALDQGTLQASISSALLKTRYARINCYGDGQTGNRIAGYLADIPLSSDLLFKCNAY